jgi:predicted transcriptional regulator
MAEPIKFTEEEQNQINEIRQQANQVFSQLGQVRIERARRLKEVEDAEENLLVQHQELVTKEQELFKTLNEKYGDGNYNPETGEFTPLEEDTKE